MNPTELGDRAGALYNARTREYVAINRGGVGSVSGARVASLYFLTLLLLHPLARNSSSCSRVPTCAIFIMIWTTNAK
jgi:hypothetical protein